MSVNEEDFEVLQHHLGRVPRGVLSVETRCPAGHPQVIKVYPLLRTKGRLEPFPTLFWLTCPNLIKQLSALEHRGWIARLEQRLQDDDALRAAYHLDHGRYRDERWQTLSEPDRALLLAKGWEGLDRGIGGIADWDHIKCLHLHYAHHAARTSVVGRWLEERFQFAPCP